jgi:hypothetical protein
MEMEGKVVDGTERGYSEGSYKYDTDNEIDDGITSYPALQMESRRIFYSKFFNLMKSCYRY